MSRFAYTTFCDDVRQEVNGKAILIGVYSGTMFVPEFPFVSPKLCVSMTAAATLDDVFSEAKFRVFQDGALLIEIEVPKEEIETAFRETPIYPGAEFRTLSTLALATPIIFEKESRLTVEAELDGVVHRTPSLYVTKAPAGFAF